MIRDNKLHKILPLLLGISLLSGITVRKVQAKEQEPYPAIIYRHYPSVSPDLYNASMIDFGPTNDMDRLALSSPQAAKERAQQLKDLGFNLVMYSGRHFRLSYEPEWPFIDQAARNVTEACHALGIKVIEHHEFTVPAYNSYPIMLSRLDELQYDINTVEPLRWFSPENPEFLTFYENYLGKLQHAANFDAMLLDEIATAGRNAQGDRLKFEEETGLKMPYWVNEYSPPDTEAYRIWQRWRSGMATRVKEKLLHYLRTIRPDISLIGYSSDYEQSGTAGRVDLEQMVSRYCSFMGMEDVSEESLNGWRPILRSLKLRQGYGDYYGIPTWSIEQRFGGNLKSNYTAWALTQLAKTSIWVGHSLASSESNRAYLKRFIGWEKAMPQQYARTLTDTGFLMSNQTRRSSTRSTLYFDDCAGWAELLLEGNKQFDTLLDGDFYLPNRLHKYKVLILASSASLAETQAQRLQDWVHQGGTAIVTRNTSLYDAEGKELSQFRLGKAMNLRYEKYIPTPSQIKGEIGGEDVSFNARGGMTEVSLIDASKSKILAKSTSGMPAIIETPYGNGRFIYVAANIGAGNWETRFASNQKYTTEEDPGAAATVQTLYRYAHHTPAPAILDLPKNVVGLVYQEQDGAQKGAVYVQLLNATGKNVKVGDRTNGAREVTFPEIKEPLHITLRIEPQGAAEASSPMHGTVQLPALQKQDDLVKLTIPPGALQDYLQIKIPAAALENQTPPPVPIAP